MNPQEQNRQLIQQFYQAFQNGNATTMASLYHEEAQFEDPVFGQLRGSQVPKMWEMLIKRSKGNLELSFSDIQGSPTGGSANWEAKYTFGSNGRKVHNKIHSNFVIKDGKITDQRDHFNFWKWSAMALGLPGQLLGFTPLMKNKVQKNARATLKKYMEKQV